MLVSEEQVKDFGLDPQAEWIGGAIAGVDPAFMGVGPIESSRKLFGKLNLNMDDVDIVEGNEAFAAQAIVFQRELNIPNEKLNIRGGAIALGHPIGASGCRILVTLIHELKNAQIGLAALCVGGGMGHSTIVRRCAR